MPTYRIQPQEIVDHQLTIRGDTAHHLIRVLRVKPGEAIRCTDGVGGLWDGTIEEVQRETLLVALGPMVCMESPILQITVAAALLPHDRWRYLIEKGVELGALAIQPLLTARTVVKSNGEKLEKWQAIADAAAEQCGTAYAPTVLLPLTFDDWLQRTTEFATIYLCHTEPDDGATPNAVPLDTLAQTTSQKVAVIIGPEGGWTDDEVAHAHSAGAQQLSLGPLTLRTETAAVAALTRLQSSDW